MLVALPAGGGGGGVFDGGTAAPRGAVATPYGSAAARTEATSNAVGVATPPPRLSHCRDRAGTTIATRDSGLHHSCGGKETKSGQDGELTLPHRVQSEGHQEARDGGR